MTYIEPGKWTCPSPDCGRTVVITGTDADTRAAIHAVQRRHATAHRPARRTAA